MRYFLKFSFHYVIWTIWTCVRIILELIIWPRHVIYEYYILNIYITIFVTFIFSCMNLIPTYFQKYFFHCREWWGQSRSVSLKSYLFDQHATQRIQRFHRYGFFCRNQWVIRKKKICSYNTLSLRRSILL